MSAPGAGPAAEAREIPAARRRRADRAFVLACLAATSLSSIVLVVLIVAILAQGWKHLDAGFLTGYASRFPARAGIRAAMMGSIWACLICLITAVPIGVGAAILLEEYRPRDRFLRRLHDLFQLNVANLAGVPSVVYGIIGLTAFARMFGLLGSANLSTYDRIEVVRLKDSGREIRGAVAEETESTLTIRDPVQGEILLKLDEIRRLTPVFARAYTFELNDGTRVTGRLEEGGPPTIRLTVDAPGGGSEELEIASAGVARWSTDNMASVGDPDSWWHVRLPFGGSVLAGGLTLALVVLPIVIVATREALRAVPESLRAGALALGATKWQTISSVVLPGAAPGIMTGAILAVSRAIGEAAPILVVSGVVFILYSPRNMMSDFTVLPLQIFSWASMPQEEFHKVAASGIIVLLGVLLIFNAAAIIIRQKLQKPLQ